MHSSWGRLYSPPPFSVLYNEYGAFSNPSLPFVVDVDSDPLESTAYEIGIQYGIDRSHLIDVTAYYRDIENYSRVGYSINPDQASSPGFASYVYSTSAGYADARGVEVSLERNSGARWISGRFNYAYSYIKSSVAAGSTSHVPDKNSYSAEADGGRPIPFEDRKTFNTYEQNVNGGGNSLLSGYDRKHRLGLTLTADLSELTPGSEDRLAITGISTISSGFYYRVTETTLELRDREVANGPWNYRTDLRLTYGFGIGQRRMVSAFFEVRNIFDRENIISYDTASIASRGLWESTGDPTGLLNRPNSNQGVSFYDIPRETNFGISLDF